MTKNEQAKTKKNQARCTPPAGSKAAKTSPTELPQRIDSHRIDTKAVRLVISSLHEDWLIRSLEERDYGVDLQLEIFDNDFPTGHLVFSQVKGMDKSFNDEPSFNLEVKTILYAQLFQAPFFLFRTSLIDKTTRFVWLQKFAETALPLSSPNWKNQKTVSVLLPEENDLAGNREKFLRIVGEQSRHRTALEFLKIESQLALHAPSVIKLRKEEVGVAAFCAAEARKLMALQEFILGCDFQGSEDLTSVERMIAALDDIARTQTVTSAQREKVTDALERLSVIKFVYLSEQDIDQFSTEHGIILY